MPSWLETRRTRPDSDVDWLQANSAISRAEERAHLGREHCSTSPCVKVGRRQCEAKGSGVRTALQADSGASGDPLLVGGRLCGAPATQEKGFRPTATSRESFAGGGEEGRSVGGGCRLQVPGGLSIWQREGEIFSYRPACTSKMCPSAVGGSRALITPVPVPIPGSRKLDIIGGHMLQHGGNSWNPGGSR